MFSVEGNNAANGLQKLNFWERKPVNTDMLLLANEGFEKGDCGRDDTEERAQGDLLQVKNDSSGSKDNSRNRKRKALEKIKSTENEEVLEGSKDKENKKAPSRNARRRYAKRARLREMAETTIPECHVTYHMEAASGSKEDPGNQKRKAMEKLKGSEENKQCYEAVIVANDARVPTERKFSSQNKEKTDSCCEDNEQSTELSEKNDESTPDVKRNNEVQDRSKDKETTKGPSRSARRRYAKRTWLREMAKTAISEGHVSYHMEDASGSMEDFKNQKRKAQENFEGSVEKKQRSDASDAITNDAPADLKRNCPFQNKEKAQFSCEDNVEHNHVIAKQNEKNDISIPHVKGRKVVSDGRYHHVGIFLRIKAMLTEALRGFEPSKKVPEAAVFWEAPARGWVKLNCDGSVLYGIINSGAAGGVIRDEDGIWILGFAMKLGDCTVIEAELLAIRQGLILAWEKRLPKILVESDSNIVVNLILSNDTRDHPLQNILQEVRALLRLPWESKLRHRRRKANKVADALARSGHSLVAILLTWDEPPSYILSLLEKERLQAASVPKENRNDEACTSKETNAAETAPQETKKVTSRNFRRKFAKRLWIKEIAKTKKASESEGQEAEGITKEAIKEKICQYLNRKEHKDSSDEANETIVVGGGDEQLNQAENKQSNHDGGIRGQKDKGNTSAYERSNHRDDLAAALSYTREFSKEVGAFLELAIEGQTGLFVHQNKPKKNGDKAEETIVVGDRDITKTGDSRRKRPKTDQIVRPAEQINANGGRLFALTGNKAEASNDMVTEQTIHQNHELLWNEITTKEDKSLLMEKFSSGLQNDNGSSNKLFSESSSHKIEEQHEIGIDVDKLLPLPSTPKSVVEEYQGVQLDSSLYKEDVSFESHSSSLIDLCAVKPEISEAISVASSNMSEVPGKENTRKPVLPSSNDDELEVSADESGEQSRDEIFQALKDKNEQLAITM